MMSFFRVSFNVLRRWRALSHKQDWTLPDAFNKPQFFIYVKFCFWSGVLDWHQNEALLLQIGHGGEKVHRILIGKESARNALHVVLSYRRDSKRNCHFVGSSWRSWKRSQYCVLKVGISENRTFFRNYKL